MKKRLNIQLKIWDTKGKLVVKTSKRISSRIAAIAQRNLQQKAYIKVTYDYNRGFVNEGIYDNYKDLKEALSAFTEKPLLDYLLEDKNENRSEN